MNNVLGRTSLLARSALVLAGIALVLVGANIYLALTNITRSATVTSRQQFIDQSAQLGRINQALVTALAQTAVKTKDDAILQLLSSNGITLDPKALAAAAQPPAAAPAVPSGKGK